jgi:hypothetical protein
MRLALILGCCLVLPFGTLTVQADESGAEPADTGEIQRLIRGLSAPKFSERRQAYFALRVFGPLAIEPLRRATDDGDPEIISFVVELLEGWSLDSDRRIFEPAARALTEMRNAKNGELSRRSEGAFRVHLDHRRALAQRAIHDLGGKVVINPAGGNGKLVYVTLGTEWQAGEDLTTLLELGALQQLTLDSPVFGDSTLRQVGQIGSIQTLNIFSGNYSLAGYRGLTASLGELNSLTTLTMKGIQGIPDFGEALAPLATLSTLSLQQMDLSGADLAPLKSLSLRSIYLSDVKLPENGLSFLEDMQSLQYLTAQSMSLAPEDMGSLAKATGLATINLRTVPLNEKNMAAFVGATVTTLQLTTTGISGKALAPLAANESLGNVRFTEPELTDESLPELMKLGNVEQLYFQNTKITAAGQKELKKALGKKHRVVFNPALAR